MALVMVLAFNLSPFPPPFPLTPVTYLSPSILFLPFLLILPQSQRGIRQLRRHFVPADVDFGPGAGRQMQAVKIVESSAQRIVAAENEDASIRRQRVGHVGPRRRAETGERDRGVKDVVVVVVVIVVVVVVFVAFVQFD